MVRRPQETAVLVLRGPLDDKTKLLISGGQTVTAKLICLFYLPLHIFINCWEDQEDFFCRKIRGTENAWISAEGRILNFFDLRSKGSLI